MTLRTGLEITAVVLGLGGIAYSFYSSHHAADVYAKQLELVNQNHTVEMQKVNQALADEKTAHDENEKQYKDALTQVSAQYNQALQALQVEKKKKTAEILINRDPEVLAKKLADTMGFQLVTK